MTDSSPRPPSEDEPEDEGAARDGGIEPAGDDALEADEVVEGEVEPDRRLSQPASFAGPLPPPNVLEEYNQVVPGLKNDIVDQWRAETAHRHQTIDGMRDTDHQAMRAFYDGEKRGQYLGFIVLVGVLVVAVLSILLDQPVVGVASLVAAGGAAIWALRRSSVGSDQSPPPNVGNGDAIEKPPGPSSDSASEGPDP